MELGMEKCSVLVIVGIELPDSKVIKSLQEGGGYKYIGSLEAERFLEEEMKLKVPKEYFRRLKKSWSQNWMVGFSSMSQYVGNLPFKIFNNIC